MTSVKASIAVSRIEGLLVRFSEREPDREADAVIVAAAVEVGPVNIDNLLTNSDQMVGPFLTVLFSGVQKIRSVMAH